jgi:hypothetical protein
MAVYRVYRVHEDGRLEPDASFYAATDEEAVCKLHHPAGAGVRAELWQGGRFIAVAGPLCPWPVEGRGSAHV